MNRRLSFLSVSILLIAFNLSMAQNAKTESQKLTLRITSNTKNPISFTATILFRTEKVRIDNVKQDAPYEITVESNYVNAIVTKTSGNGNLIVELVNHKKNGELMSLTAISSTIVVGTRDATKGEYYQQTF